MTYPSYISDLSVEIPKERLDKLREDLAAIPEEIPRIERAALKAGLRAMRAQMVRRAAHDLGLPQRTVRERAWGDVIRTSELTRDLTGRVRGGKFGWKWVLFRHEQTDEGVEIMEAGKARLLPHTFLAKVGYQVTGGGAGEHEGIFLRRGKARLPIYEPRTSPVTEAIVRIGAEKDIHNVGLEAAMDVLEARTQRLLMGGAA